MISEQKDTCLYSSPIFLGIALCANNYEITEQNALAPRGLTTDNCNLHTRLVLCQMIFQMDVEVKTITVQRLEDRHSFFNAYITVVPPPFLHIGMLYYNRLWELE
jgi:hypothetical protein